MERQAVGEGAGVGDVAAVIPLMESSGTFTPPTATVGVPEAKETELATPEPFVPSGRA